MTESYTFKLFSDDNIQFIDESASTVKVHLYVDEDTQSVKVKLQPISKVVWSGKNLSKPKIKKNSLATVRDYFEVPTYIELDPQILDQARVHSRYAINFNRRRDIFHQLLFNGEAEEKEIQLSYGHGLSFIGNAIMQFVASLIVFTETSMDTTNNEMESKMRTLLKPEHLATHCEESGWASVLAYNAKELSIYSKKGEKIYSDQLKAFIGALYASNHLNKLPEILEITKKLLTTNDNISFGSLIKQDIDITSLGLGIVLGFGMGMFIMALVTYVSIYL